MNRVAAVSLLVVASYAALAQTPKPIGKMVDVGGHRVHLHCTGRGRPTVVVENGFDEFSFDWVMVQAGVERFTRVCTYDRAGYAWSDPGPLPRTYAQINLELRDVLEKSGERGPYLLVGHSFGGPVIRNFAMTYPKEVAGLVFVESAGESHRIIMGTKTARIADFAQGRAIPPTHDYMKESDRVGSNTPPPHIPPIESPFDRLSADLQKLQIWAWSQSALQDAENSERDWSPEYLAQWLKQDQKGSLGSLPITVLAREKGGFEEGHDLSAAELERQRRQEQSDMAALSSRGRLSYVNSGHEMELEAPEVIVKAVHQMVVDRRKHSRL